MDPRQPNPDHWARGALQAASVVLGGLGGNAVGGPFGMVVGAAIGGAAATQIPHFEDDKDMTQTHKQTDGALLNPGDGCEPVPGDAGDRELAKGFYDGAHRRSSQAKCSFLPSVYQQGYDLGVQVSACVSRRSPNPSGSPALPPGIFLDVRTPWEQAHGVIPGALTIEWNRLPKLLWPLLAATDRGGKRIYVYCKRGRRSAVAAEYLRNLGFRAYDIGGIEQGTAKQIYDQSRAGRATNPMAPTSRRPHGRPCPFM